MNKNIVYLLFVYIAITNNSLKANQKRLIGLFNGLDRQITLVDKGHSNIQSLPQTRGKVPAYVEPIALPVKVEVQYPDALYTIAIKESGAACDAPGHSRVTAEVFKEGAVLGDKYTQSACVTNANSSVIPGKRFDWGNLMLAIGPNPKYSKGSTELPFRFGVSAWTSTRNPWHLPTVDKTADGAIPFQESLSVMQGFAALGSGLLPRLGHANIVHLYNNSPYLLMYASDYRERLPLAASGFNQLIPPYTAVPWITTWVPKVAKNKIDSLQKSMLTMRVLHPPVKQGELPPDPSEFTLIGKAGGFELAEEGMSKEEIAEEVDEIIAKVPDLVSEIMKTKSVTDLIDDRYEDYYVSNFYFAIMTDDATGKIHVQKCYPDTHRCDSVYVSDEAAYSGPNPGYYKLLVSPAKQEGQIVDFAILPMVGEVSPILE